MEFSAPIRTDGARKAIMVVEDDVGLNRLICRLLERCGHSTIAAFKGEEAIETAMREPVRLMLLDFILPDMSGIMVVEALSEKQLQMPFLIVTGRGDEKVAVQSLKLGARDYIVKESDFLERVPQIVERELKAIDVEESLQRTEQALKESEERYRSIIEQSHDAIILHINGVIEYANQRFLNLCGCTAEETLGVHITSLLNFTPESAALMTERLAMISEGNTPPRDFECTIIRKDGQEIFIEAAAGTIRMTQSAARLVTMRDVTEKKRLQRENERLENELGRQFHLTQIGLLTSGIVHNLRDPLSIITMQTSMLMMKLKGIEPTIRQHPEPLRKFIEYTRQSTEYLIQGAARLQQIIEEMTDYNKMNRAAGSSTHNLNQILRADINILRADMDIKHKIRMIPELSEQPVTVRIRAGDITQIFLNLISNARDAVLSCDVRKITVRSGVDADNKRAWFEVADSGAGIPPGVQSHFGEPFLTTKTSDAAAQQLGSGTGLGIYMVKRLLSQIEGRMEISSLPGGTRVRIYLPLAAG